MWIDDRHLEIINIGLEVIRRATMDMPLHLKMRDLRIHQIVDAIAALSAPAPEQGELKPCPFCGGEAYLDAMNPPLHEIRCADCASCGQIKTNKDEAIAAWNRRTPPAPSVPAVPDEIAETIRCALDETAEDIGMNPAFYADPHEAMRKVEAALAWLAQQRAAPDEETA